MAVGPKATVSVQINLAVGDSIAKSSVMRGVIAASYEAEALLVDILSQPGQGKVYKRGKKKHRASKAGDPPAVDTGNLRRNRSREVYETPEGATAILAANMEYAEALELGTEKVEPRPFISKLITDDTKSSRIEEAFRIGARLDD